MFFSKYSHLTPCPNVIVIMGNVMVIKANTNMKMVNVFTPTVSDIPSMKSIKKIKLDDNLEIDKTGKRLGKISLNRLSENLSTSEFKSYFIKFEKGSKSKTHIHNSDQIIIGMEGIGRLVTFSKIEDKNTFETKESLELKEGEAILLPSGTPHWHGASENHSSSQLSFMKNSDTTWFDF